MQGVGFRPAVYRLATALGLAGWVRNHPDGVTIELEGPREKIERFQAELPQALEAPAALAEVAVEAIAPQGETTFAVTVSTTAGPAAGTLPADTAICRACRSDLERPGDRRYRYPFTTCSHCGPRFSLVTHLPYDRVRTSMACFPFCADCEREYGDPGDRRFHAEPLACLRCGPRLWYVGRGEEVAGEATAPAPAGERAAPIAAAVAAARAALERGEIVAVKGLGGFQLACRADREAVIQRLRLRKRRTTKPLAVMARNAAAARELVRLTAGAEARLASGAAPILLAPIRGEGLAAAVHEAIAPGLSDLGVMLPTTPLHIELFRGAEFDRLIMTSGNVSDEPICCGNREARERLAGIADGFLLHDRDVVRRLDDTVERTEAACDEAAEAPPDPATPKESGAGVAAASFVVRRSRGWVPSALPLPEPAPAPVMALGGHLQATACLAARAQAIPSQHVGDLDGDAARAFLREAAEGLEELFQVRAEAFAVDLHPDYPSSWLGETWARERGAELVRVPHHLAHAAATLAEHEAFPPVMERCGALVLDGTGFGLDETAWGGELLWLQGNLAWGRAGHLEAIELIGGERAVREPWRVAAAMLFAGGAPELLERTPLALRVAGRERDAVLALAGGDRWPQATGAGRLFEAAGALFGLATVNGYEGEAAARFEALATQGGAERAARGASQPAAESEMGAEWTGAGPAWPEAAAAVDAARGTLASSRLLVAAARRLAAGEPAARVAWEFHRAFAGALARLTDSCLPPEVACVALGGGCFVNRLLRRACRQRLAAGGWRVLLPVRVPPGDGGLSYGQAVLATVAAARGVTAAYQAGVAGIEGGG